MNPLTQQVKLIQSINAKESELGISEEASWNTNYKYSAYVYVGGAPYDLTEGDLLAVFLQQFEWSSGVGADRGGNYGKREEEDEEPQRQNREARRVCRAFQRGECIRGDSCKFSHDEKRAGNLVGVMKRIETPGGIMTILMVQTRVVQVLAIETISNLMLKIKTVEKGLMEVLYMAALKEEWGGRCL